MQIKVVVTYTYTGDLTDKNMVVESEAEYWKFVARNLAADDPKCDVSIEEKKTCDT